MSKYLRRPGGAGTAQQTIALGHLDFQADLQQADKTMRGLRASGTSDAKLAARRAQLRAELLAKRHDLKAIQEALK